jgi:hypothetical protein
MSLRRRMAAMKRLGLLILVIEGDIYVSVFT